MAYKDKKAQKENAATYYQRNKGIRAKQTREWIIAHPNSALLMRAKQNARNKGIEFNLELDDIYIPDVCPYLKIPLTHMLPGGKGNGHGLDSNMSVDRIDSSKGYVKGNIEVISNLANRMKNSATVEQLLTFAHSITTRYYDENT